MQRLKESRSPRLEDVIYDLGVESKATSFDKLYLVTEDGWAYSSVYLETALTDMPWSKDFLQSDGNFVTRYSEDSREQWGEFLIYGSHLQAPVTCGDKKIAGVVGLVPISEISSQMRLESFDGQGVAIVMQPSGEIVTASQHYRNKNTTQNFLSSLEGAEFKKGKSLESCNQAIQHGESLFIEYSVGKENYYALFQPMDHREGTDWYLVVRVSAKVTADQVRTLISRSIPFFFILGFIILAIVFFLYRSINETRVARASEQAKSVFLANMSHEIRTPLNGIVGLQYLMRQNLQDSEKLEEYLKKAEISAEFLKSVITDVLDMSKIESGQLELYENETDLSKLIDEVRLLLITQAENNGLNLSIDCANLQNQFVMCDALRLKQILTNLLSNALKFTPAGGEVSLAALQKVDNDIAHTTFKITDSGCGMSPEFLKRIWLPFEQERRIASQNGTGLGSTLSKTLVEKMGGTIEVESQLNTGSVFTVTIPFSIVHPPQNQKNFGETDTGELKLSGKKILIAEDNEINRMIVVSILQEHGCILIEAANGEEAVSIFKNSPSDSIDLVLMDVQMPLLDGYVATRRIRALPRSDAQTVPIFAVTANAFGEDVEKAIAAGMNDVIIKPLDVSLLLNKIRNLLDLEALK